MNDKNSNEEEESPPPPPQKSSGGGSSLQQRLEQQQQRQQHQQHRTSSSAGGSRYDNNNTYNRDNNRFGRGRGHNNNNNNRNRNDSGRYNNTYQSSHGGSRNYNNNHRRQRNDNNYSNYNNRGYNNNHEDSGRNYNNNNRRNSPSPPPPPQQNQQQNNRWNDDRRNNNVSHRHDDQQHYGTGSNNRYSNFGGGEERGGNRRYYENDQRIDYGNINNNRSGGFGDGSRGGRYRDPRGVGGRFQSQDHGQGRRSHGGRDNSRGGRGGAGRGRSGNRNNHRHYNRQRAAEDWKPRGPGEFRGIFGPNGDSTDWLMTTSQFPNGVPRFETKKECLKFMKEYTDIHGGSNPNNPILQHIFTTLTTWDEMESILIPAMEQARREPTSAAPVPTSYGLQPSEDSKNIYEQSEMAQNLIVDAINKRLDQPFHQNQTTDSVLNALKYSFHHMKRGIYVMIHNGQLWIFCPFSNEDYTNTWSHALKMEGNLSVEEYYDKKAKTCRREIIGRDINPDMSKWWANGNIICNTPCKGDNFHASQLQQWGDHFLCPIRDALSEACRERQIPDCEFFLNKRDYPQIKVNVERGVPVEPYGFIFNCDDRDPKHDVDLVPEHCYPTLAPMVSFYAASEDRFTDLPFPSSEDWEGACGMVFPQTFISFEEDDHGRPEFHDPRDLFTEANFRKFERSWDNNDRVATAFFRGTATGGGTTIETNQRLNLAHLSHQWKDDSDKGGEIPFLDAALTGWNTRDKKTAHSPMTYVRREEFDFTAGRHNFTPIYEQSRYKYLVYVDGHCAACRYGFMMRLGCVILKVESRQVADRMWYFPLLQPWKDHIPIKSDLSDLEEKIRWCRANDDKCREIADNSVQFYHKYVAKKPLLDYIEMVTKHIAKRQAGIREEIGSMPADSFSHGQTRLQELVAASGVTPTSVAIIAPFRDIHAVQKRSMHLGQFIPHMINFLSNLKDRGMISDFHIYILEQSDDGRKFNRGKLLNVGFEEARKSSRNHDVFIFHDVDLLPDSDLGPWYAKFPRRPIHIARVWDRYSGNENYFGGVVSISSSDFQRINGFPNTFWGWGGEDDELQKRCHKLRMRWVWPDEGSLRDLEDMSVEEKVQHLRDNRDWKCMVKRELLEEHDRTWKANGLGNLKYSILKQESLHENNKATKITVDVGSNDDHWSNEHSKL